MTRPAVYFSQHTRSLRIFWLFEELGLDYEPRPVAFPPRDKAPDYLKLNPSGTLPAVVDGDLVLTESMAIGVHYATQRRSDLIVGEGEADRPQYLQWLWYGESTLMTPISMLVRIHRLGVDLQADPLAADARETLEARLAPLEQRLQGREFLAADRFTLADISTGYALYVSRLFRLPLPENTAAYWARLKERPALQKAMAVSAG